jgi:hypothetical protein
VALTQVTDIRGGAELVDMKLEVVVGPVADVDRAKSFHQALGWREDADRSGRRGQGRPGADR